MYEGRGARSHHHHTHTQRYSEDQLDDLQDRLALAPITCDTRRAQQDRMQINNIFYIGPDIYISKAA